MSFLSRHAHDGVRPEQWVKPMAVAGANQYTFHLEATDNPGALIKDIRENGLKVRA